MEAQRLSPHTEIAMVAYADRPPKVIVNDCTLREGIQVSRGALCAADRLRLVRAIDALGVPQIQIGYPGLSALDAQVATMARAAGVQAELEAMCSASALDWERQLDATVACGVERIMLIYPTADFRLRNVLGITRAEALRRSEAAVARACRLFPKVTFAPVDGSRSDLGFLKEILLAVAAAGAERFYAIDTAGVATPEGMAIMVSELRAAGLPIGIHCHNDFGLALANSLAAVLAGATVVDASVNGMGKRAGNASLDEVVVALEVLYKIDTGVDTRGLYHVAREVAESCGVPLPPLKPLVGTGAFDVEVDAQLRAARGHIILRALEPEFVGHPG